MTKPKISIVVPIYGVEKYLHQCVDSILAQTLKEIEVILVDDGSKDRSPEIVDEYTKKDSRVIAVHQPNGGYGKAVNHGLKIASGEYIGIVEPDDWIEPTMYEKLYHKALQTNVDIVKSNFFNELPSRQQKNNWTKNLKIPKDSFSFQRYPIFLYFHPSIWSCLYKSSLIKKKRIQMQETPGAGWADNLFQVKTLFYANKIAYLDDAFYHYRRQNEDDAKDLKDWHIPFERTKEIHKWMNQQKITNQDIWGCLYKRELAYICLVCRMVPFKQIKQVLPHIIFCLQDMNPDIIKRCRFITEKEREKIASFLKYPRLTLFRNKNKLTIKKIRRFLISFRIRRSSWLIQLLGIQITKGKLAGYHPALVKIKIGK